MFLSFMGMWVLHECIVGANGRTCVCARVCACVCERKRKLCYMPPTTYTHITNIYCKGSKTEIPFTKKNIYTHTCAAKSTNNAHSCNTHVSINDKKSGNTLHIPTPFALLHSTLKTNKYNNIIFRKIAIIFNKVKVKLSLCLTN
jgi:hypothetical protein